MRVLRQPPLDRWRWTVGAYSVGSECVVPYFAVRITKCWYGSPALTGTIGTEGMFDFNPKRVFITIGVGVPVPVPTDTDTSTGGGGGGGGGGSFSFLTQARWGADPLVYGVCCENRHPFAFETVRPLLQTPQSMTSAVHAGRVVSPVLSTLLDRDRNARRDDQFSDLSNTSSYRYYGESIDWHLDEPTSDSFAYRCSGRSCMRPPTPNAAILFE